MDVGKIIAAPPSTVWHIIISTKLWPIWGPSLKSVDCTDELISLHSTGRVQTAFGAWFPFKITEFQAPLYWNWRVNGIPATGHRIKPLSDHHCELIFEIPYGLFPYVVICQKAAKNIERLALKM